MDIHNCWKVYDATNKSILRNKNYHAQKQNKIIVYVKIFTLYHPCIHIYGDTIKVLHCKEYTYAGQTVKEVSRYVY